METFFLKVIFVWHNFYLTKGCFCDINFFLWHKFFSVTKMFFCYIYFILWRKFFLSKTPFLGHFIRDFQGKVSVRNRIFRYLGYPRYPLCGALLGMAPLDYVQTEADFFRMVSLSRTTFGSRTLLSWAPISIAACESVSSLLSLQRPDSYPFHRLLPPAAMPNDPRT